MIVKSFLFFNFKSSLEIHIPSKRNILEKNTRPKTIIIDGYTINFANKPDIPKRNTAI